LKHGTGLGKPVSRQFRQKDLVEMVAEVVRESALPWDHLEVEITEGLVMLDVEASVP
jgi:EAL domain-containing protein (putative c-di-GMP-specific phosphodiesterase class I)